MLAGFRSGLIHFAAGSILAALSIPLVAQQARGDLALNIPAVFSSETMADAPVPQIDVAANDLPDDPSAGQVTQDGAGQENSAGPNSAGQSSASQTSSSSQNSAQQPDTQEQK